MHHPGPSGRRRWGRPPAPARTPRRERRKALIVSLAMLLAAARCASQTPSVTPTASSLAERSTASAAAGSTGSGPDLSPATTEEPPSPSETGEPAPTAPQPPAVVLPRPTLTEPFEIGGALYDPNRVAEGVVSMLALMDVDVVGADGTSVWPDLQPSPGSRWLYDVEVRQMIDRTVDELLAAGEDGAEALPFTIGDIYDALAPALPGASAAEVVDGYVAAYAGDTSALVPQLMLGQPIDASTRLSTAQAWLLLMDGFVGPAASTGERVTAELAVSGRGAAAWGTALAFMPLLGNLSPMTEAEMRELIVHLDFLLACITWDITPAIAHEGHGKAGTPVTLVGGPVSSRPIISRTTHRPLVEQVNGDFGDTAGIPVTWKAANPEVFAQHGAFERSLPAMSTLTGVGLSIITYTPRREPADGAGEPFSDDATIELTAPAAELVRAYYRMPNPQLDPMLESLLAATFGQLKAGTYTNVEIGWHAPGLTLTITNEVDVDLEAGVGFEGRMSRKGDDTLSGSLSRRSDGSYAGVLTAGIDRFVKMTFTVPLAAGGCDGRTRTKQSVYVVARRVASAIDRRFDELTDGTFGPDDLLLTLYPVGAPTAPPMWCEDMLPRTGAPTIDGRTVWPTLIPLNDLRWTKPGALRVHLPAVHDHLEYRDTSDAALLRGFNSVWTFTIDRGE